jgi:hypothetical protein
VIWHKHIDLGIHESGFYTVRRVVQGYETWYKQGQHFKRVGRSSSLSGAKNDAEQHAKGMK